MKVTLNPQTIVDTIESRGWFLVNPYPTTPDFYAIANKRGGLFRWNVSREQWRELKELYSK